MAKGKKSGRRNKRSKLDVFINDYPGVWQALLILVVGVLIIEGINIFFVRAPICLSVSSDTTLTGDIICTDNQLGVYIDIPSNSHVTLDCAGYSIILNRTPNGLAAGRQYVIKTNRSVTVKNCNIVGDPGRFLITDRYVAEFHHMNNVTIDNLNITGFFNESGFAGGVVYLYIFENEGHVKLTNFNIDVTHWGDVSANPTVFAMRNGVGKNETADIGPGTIKYSSTTTGTTLLAFSTQDPTPKNLSWNIHDITTIDGTANTNNLGVSNPRDMTFFSNHFDANDVSGSNYGDTLNHYCKDISLVNTFGSNTPPTRTVYCLGAPPPPPPPPPPSGGGGTSYVRPPVYQPAPEAVEAPPAEVGGVAFGLGSGLLERLFGWLRPVLEFLAELADWQILLLMLILGTLGAYIYNEQQKK